MHPLTQKSFDWDDPNDNKKNWEHWETEVLLPYLNERAEWLKQRFPNTEVWAKRIDDCLGLLPPEKTLEEKIQKVFEAHAGGYCLPDVNALATLAREHLKKHPEELQ